MFSKTYTSNLNYIPNNFSSKYKSLSNLYINDLTFLDSHLYGLKRQHNFLSMSSFLNNQSTFMNLKSINKIANFNFKNNSLNEIESRYNNLNFFKKNFNSSFSTDSSRLHFIFKQFNNFNEFRLNKFISYSNTISSINDKTKNKLNYPIYKLFNIKLDNNISLNNIDNFNNLSYFNDLSLMDSNNEIENFFFNKNFNYKLPNYSSSNNFLLPSERFIRKFVKTSSSLINFNHSLSSNTLNEYFLDSNLNSGFTNSQLLNLSNNH
jgi:hypothetical protein